MRAGGDHRGSAASRRARKNWMLTTFGDGVKARCAHCAALLDFAAIEADRIIPGGPYARHNIQPACRACNLARSDNTDWAYTVTTV